MIQLFEFQQTASSTISDRFIEYIDDPVVVGTKKTARSIPFFQALASLTASGKTAMLIDAVATMADALPTAPVILWLSKGKVVVEQSYANIVAGGKYHHLLGDSTVSWLAEYDATDVAESSRPLVYFATVGTFNQKDKEDGTLLLYRSEIDTAEESTWDALKSRTTVSGEQRPLIIVYDEAHNLSDQQTELLLELGPSAVLLASATMKLPKLLANEVEELKRQGKDDDWLITRVDAKAVADAGLVKSRLLLGGYRAPMEETVGSMLDDLSEAEADAKAQGLDGEPKAIYACQTNVVEGNSYQKDDPKQPFNQRQAPPILIWRFLTESRGIDPSRIAVYSSLAFHKDYPPPSEFVHFKGGDNDYSAFAAGDFQHVIFNLSLQEGWDDPFCYFAYVDKSMESKVQVEQVIGRVLRQPGAKRFGADRLNTAHFYVRVDRNEVFSELIKQVAQRLATDAPEIKLVSTAPGKPRPSALHPQDDYSIPTTAYDSRHARAPVQAAIDALTDYRHDDGTNVESTGERGVLVQNVGESATDEVSWHDFKSSNRVAARWVFQREVRRRFQGALQVADVSLPKFDAMIGLGSNAYTHVGKVAAEVVDAYLDNVFLVQKKLDPYTVGTSLVRTDEMIAYEHSVHAGYDGLNTLELAFAAALDQHGLPWYRNPPRSGYGIPLITMGTTSNFYPDFFVWKDDVVIGIDTKGGHLLQDAAARKLLRIRPPKDGTQRLILRFISPGEWTPQIEPMGKQGYTVWGLKQDGTRRATHVDDLEAALERVLDTDDT